MKTRWHKAALKDLATAIEFARLGSERSATDLAGAMDRGIEQLMAHPESGRAGKRAGTRELLIGDGSYLIVYRVGNGEVVIARVLHTSRGIA